MASSTCSSSLLLQSTPLRGLILSKTRIPTPFLFSSPLSVTSLIKTHNSFNLVTPVVLKDATHFSSAFIRSVSVSSEFDLEEGVSSEEQNFSPDLKLFVGNLPFNVDSAELAGLFEQAGNVEMVEVIYDKLTGKSRGFGFVTMSTVDEVETAQQQFNGYELDGRTLRVNSGPPPPKDEFPSRGSRVGGSSESSNRVYVGNLSWAVDDSALETLFSEQGRVLEAKVVYDRETGRSRGFGFVTYGSAKEVDNAISSLNGVDLNGRSIRVTVAESKPRRQF